MFIDFKLIKFVSSAFSAKSNGKFGAFTKSVAFISIFLGTLALILSLSVLDGFDKALHLNATKFSAHIVIKSFTKEPLYNYPKLLTTLNTNFNQIFKTQPVIEREGLIKSKNNVDGVLIRGIYPEMDITEIKKLIKFGKFEFSTNFAKEAIISKRMADRLNTKIGDWIVLFALDGDSYNDMPEPKIAKFKVTGIYQSGMAKYDDVLIFIPYLSASKFFNIPENSASVIEIILNDVNQASTISKQLDDNLKYPYYTLTIFDLHQQMFSWIELQKEPIPIVLGLISIVAVLNIITALLIIVVEKTQSIGILRTLGMNNLNILYLFLYQGLKLGIKGILAGTITAYLLCWLQINYQIIKLNGEIYFLDVLPMDISWWHYEIVISITLLLTISATIIPAFIAVKIKPVQALKFK